MISLNQPLTLPLTAFVGPSLSLGRGVCAAPGEGMGTPEAVTLKPLLLHLHALVMMTVEALPGAALDGVDLRF